MEKLPETGTFIEGIGDEVIWGSVMCISTVSLAVSLYVWNFRSTNQQGIHPESEENVQNARDRLRSENRIPPERVSTRQRDENHECPICITTPAFAVETNCGHVFCGRCIITYWQSGAWLGSIRCPVCRQPVNLLLYLFSEEEINASSDEKDEVISKINLYNRRFSGEQRTLLQHVQDLPVLLRHLWLEFWSLNGTGLVFVFRLRIITLLVFAVLYFVSPLDLIPEAVFGLLGFLDDLFIILLLVLYLSIIYRRMLAQQAAAEAQNESAAAAAAAQAELAAAAQAAYGTG